MNVRVKVIEIIHINQVKCGAKMGGSIGELTTSEVKLRLVGGIDNDKVGRLFAEAING